jgi:hypothetical protein
VEHCRFFGDEKTIEEVGLIEFKTFDESKFLERRRFWNDFCSVSTATNDRCFENNSNFYFFSKVLVLWRRTFYEDNRGRRSWFRYLKEM